jgi:hypothetical protein
VNFAGTEPASILTGISPANSATGVSRIPTFAWSATTTSNGVGLGTEVDKISSGNRITGKAPLAITTTAWPCPVTLDPTAQYAFIATVYQGSTSTNTIAGTTFPIYSLYGYLNEVDFTTGTTPEPATLVMLAMGCAVFAARRGRR